MGREGKKWVDMERGGNDLIGGESGLLMFEVMKIMDGFGGVIMERI